MKTYTDDLLVLSACKLKANKQTKNECKSRKGTFYPTNGCLYSLRRSLSNN